MGNDNYGEAIAPELFDYVTEYVDTIEKDSSIISSPIDGDNELIFFAENFMAQFSSGYLKRSIIGFTSKSRIQLRKARRSLEKAVGTISAQHLIFHLEPLCDRVPEISYGNSEYDSEEFHTDYFPDLLQRIVDWLHEVVAGQRLREAAEEAQLLYYQAIGRDLP